MRRRNLLQMILAAPAILLMRSVSTVTAPIVVKSRSLVLQQSPLAGFQYHSGPNVWPLLRLGQPLRLVRELQNHYDERAVAVYWGDYKLGYVPRGENAAVAQMLDRAEQRLQATIVWLAEDSNPWNRVGFQIDVMV
jgi:hypothetical protein